MKAIMKRLLCFILVPLFLMLIVGGFALAGWLLVGYWYIIIPLIVVIYWGWIATELYQDLFGG